MDKEPTVHKVAEPLRNNPRPPRRNESDGNRNEGVDDTLAARVASVEEPLDFTISGINCEFQVHTSIICKSSRFFHKAVAGEFKESLSKRVHLPEEDVSTVELLVSILYGVEQSYWSELWIKVNCDVANSTSNTTMASAAVESLEPVMAADGQSPRIPQRDFGVRILRIYGLVDRYDITWLQSWARAEVLRWARTNARNDGFIEVVWEIFRCETGYYYDLIDEVSLILMENVDSWVDNSMFQQLMEECGDFALEVFRYIGQRDKLIEMSSSMYTSLEELQKIGGTQMVHEAVNRMWRINRSVEEAIQQGVKVEN
ncbi:hypothetical protein FQN55_007738 [Onygenales sp. PD_40]|nr:hypothetical protein FQN55_007738 [Onygenales sp. PD_40]KAK2775367.1 hypothetical protein FQN53_003154 [Emmonsiellopsis sp. PD_33]KAK2792635.1 hypothetical protein FQN52_003140 [Onygenales sp. PD_12]